ncbi:MAG: class I adenylate-forming enzyme family protein [Pseudomonadota bacterium]|nr:class I adenylate-forming enzyme family protein [Pseudomonadota bacterium]
MAGAFWPEDRKTASRLAHEAGLQFRRQPVAVPHRASSAPFDPEFDRLLHDLAGQGGEEPLEIVDVACGWLGEALAAIRPDRTVRAEVPVSEGGLDGDGVDFWLRRGRCLPNVTFHAAADRASGRPEGLARSVQPDAVRFPGHPEHCRVLVRPDGEFDLDRATARHGGREIRLLATDVEILFWSGRGDTLTGIALRSKRPEDDVVRAALELQRWDLVRLAPVSRAFARLHCWLRTGDLHPDPDEAVIGRIWAAAMVLHPERTAIIVQDGTTISFAEGDLLIRRCAGMLRAAGVRKGDRIAIWSSPHVMSWMLFWAAMHLGLVVVPLDPTAPGEAAAATCRRFGVGVLFGDGERLLRLERETVAGQVIEMDPPFHGAPTGVWPLVSAQLPDDPPVDVLEAGVRDSDPGVIIMTSGTTAASKAVCIAQGALYRMARHVAEHLGWSSDDRVMTTSGINHIPGIRNGYLATAHVGAAHILGHVPAPGHVLRMRELAGRHGATMMVCDPAFVRQSLELQRSGRLPPAPALRVMHSGGAPLPPSIRRDIERVLGVRLGVVYGLTEACGIGAVQFEHDGVADSENSVGRATGMVAQIRGDDGEVVPDGATGTLWLLTDRCMSGYVEAGGLEPGILRGGWIDTGDVAWRNPRGDLVVLGRRVDAMKLATGLLVVPGSLEALLEARADIAAAAFIPCVDRFGGDQLFAFAETVAEGVDGERLARELRSFIRDRLGEPFVPYGLEVVHVLPRNVNGKIRKGDLVARLPENLRPSAGHGQE